MKSRQEYSSTDWRTLPLLRIRCSADSQRGSLAWALYSGLIQVIAAKKHKEHKEVSGFSRENRSFLEIFVVLCGYRFS